MHASRLLVAVDSLQYPGLTFETNYEGGGVWSLQVSCDGTCNVTGEPLAWRGRKWPLDEHMTEGEIVRTAFLAVKVALEHEAREKFTYRGAAVFDPHFSIERLVELHNQERPA